MYIYEGKRDGKWKNSTFYRFDFIGRRRRRRRRRRRCHRIAHKVEPLESLDLKADTRSRVWNLRGIGSRRSPHSVAANHWLAETHAELEGERALFLSILRRLICWRRGRTSSQRLARCDRFRVRFVRRVAASAAFLVAQVLAKFAQELPPQHVVRLG